MYQNTPALYSIYFDRLSICKLKFTLGLQQFYNASSDEYHGCMYNKTTKRKEFIMDNKKFGQFILKLRKEKGWTQLELAEKLNITDKAVSKWERGVGFPDIKMIEPLAEIFNVSVLEIMRSERVSEQSIPTENASEAINNVIDVVSFQRKIERRNILITIITFSAIVMLLFLIDVMQWEGFIMICLPIIMLGTGLYLIGLSIYRSRQRLTYTTTLILGILALLFPLLIFLFLCFAFILGGPVPA